jgi:hypothetical protein
VRGQGCAVVCCYVMVTESVMWCDVVSGDAMVVDVLRSQVVM